MMKEIRIGTRESKLALIQAQMLQKHINGLPGCSATLLPMKTTGDKILHIPLDQIGGKGLFLKELDMALQEGKTELSVHSLKDVTMELPEGYPLLGVSVREDPRDVLVLPKGMNEIDFQKPIGCSSKRRILQMKKLFPNADFQSIRGNIETRLEKLDSGQYSALVLAAAGLKRLGLEQRISRYFTVDEIIPAAGQGMLAVQGREDFDTSVLEGFLDENARRMAMAERAFVKYLDGGCSSPIAAYAEISGDQLSLTGLYYEEQFGEEYQVGKITGDVSQAEQLGIMLAKRMRGSKDL